MIKPKLDTIVVKPDTLPEYSEGGIALLTDTVERGVKHAHSGEVVAVGPGKYDKKGHRTTMWDLAPGSRISFSPVCSVQIDHGGQKYLLIKRDSVIGLA